MPLLAKGGKFVYGWSVISPERKVIIPPQIIQEYKLPENGKIILMSSSKVSGGFSITTKAMLKQSKLNVIVNDNPELAEYSLPEGMTIKYKGRKYCWVTMENKIIRLPKQTMEAYDVKVNDKLLSIRSSNIAFTLIVKGPIIAVANQHPELEEF